MLRKILLIYETIFLAEPLRIRILYGVSMSILLDTAELEVGGLLRFLIVIWAHLVLMYTPLVDILNLRLKVCDLVLKARYTVDKLGQNLILF